MQTYAILLNWNGYALTRDCIHSLQTVTTAGLHLVVVDNGSSDGSVAKLRAAFPNITVLESEINLGFAGGVNLGMRHALAAGADYILLLNNDTVVAADFLDQLLAQARPRTILAPAIYYFDEPDRVWSVGGGFSDLLLEMTGNHGRHLELRDQPLARQFLTGCAMLLPRSIVDEVGFFDERFFMYYEDQDFCLRARQAGYELFTIPTAKIWHKVSASSGGNHSPNERYQMALSSGRYFRKHMDAARAWLIIPYRLLSALRWTMRLTLRRQWRALHAYWRGLYKGWLGKNGRGYENLAHHP